MKIKALLFIFLHFASLSFFAQTAISEIDQVVQKMKENIDSYEKVEKMDSPEGFKHFYFKDGQLQIVAVQENAKIEKNVQWFYSGKTLLYTETNWLDSLSGKNLYREKTYHDKGNLIAWLNSESTFVDSSSPEFKKLDRELKAYAVKIREEAME